MHGLNAILLLSAMINGEGTAIDMVERVQRNADKKLDLASAYVQLDRLERQGLAKSRLGDKKDARGRRRRLFRITAEGEHMLRSIELARGGVSFA
ncbi:MAG: helix-turn-helix transcriptional regulator [Planctomycetota bacterium]